MIEFFKVFRLGVVSLVGITFPGLLAFGIATAGLGLPLATVTFQLAELRGGTPAATSWQHVAALWSENRGIAVALAIVAAYVVGYVIRLASIDTLDIKSAQKVLEALAAKHKTSQDKAAVADAWVTRCEELDAYPYYYFKEYLAARKLDHVASLVEWGSPESKRNKRTKALINMMKLEVSQKSSDLSAAIESNEAHVRLLFGTWQAMGTCMPLVAVGAFISVLGVLNHFAHAVPLADAGSPYFQWLLVAGLLLLGMFWARGRIVHLFHYQRVRELTYIVASLWYVRR